MKKILVIDNDKDFRYLMGLVLPRKGYEVVLESTGHNGLTKAVKESPDAILLDIRMPTMNGTLVLKELKGDGRIAHIPVIVVTGSASDEQISEALGCGASSVLIKSFSFEQLYAEIERVLSARSDAGSE